MNIKTQAVMRKDLVSAMARFLGVKSHYEGAPTMSYTVGKYTILKDSSIEVEDSIDLDLLAYLKDMDFISKDMVIELATPATLTEGTGEEIAEEPPQDNAGADLPSTISEPEELTEEEPEPAQEGDYSLSVAIPYEGLTWKALQNLMVMTKSKQKFLNKIVGKEAFDISRDLVETLVEREFKTVEEFIEAIPAGANLKGITFTEKEICFDGFPVEDSVKTLAYLNLVSRMVFAAKKLRNVKLETADVENEKYAFRTWLVRIGMKGEEYKATRNILLQNLSGNAAFRTPDQAEAAKAKVKAKRGEAK